MERMTKLQLNDKQALKCFKIKTSANRVGEKVLKQED